MIQQFLNCFIILASILTLTFIGSQTFTASFGVTNPNLVQPTSGGSLDVKISPSSDVINTNEPVKFKVDFLEPGTDKIQVHVDYDFKILNNNGEEIFSAAKQISQPLLHTAEGSVTIPFTFPSPGEYSINIPVLGINFIPINPESAKFDFTVT
jgi:hypothetical protein